MDRNSRFASGHGLVDRLVERWPGLSLLEESHLPRLGLGGIRRPGGVLVGAGVALLL